MRRIALVVVVLALGLGLAVPTAGAAHRSRAADPTPAFCRATVGFLRFLQHAPDPKKFAHRNGRAILRSLHATAPREVDAATAAIGDSIRYLSRHGRGTLPKARDEKLGEALLRTSLFAASRCRQNLIRSYAASLAQHRIAQSEAAASSTTSTTNGAR